MNYENRHLYYGFIAGMYNRPSIDAESLFDMDDTEMRLYLLSELTEMAFEKRLGPEDE